MRSNNPVLTGRNAVTYYNPNQQQGGYAQTDSYGYQNGYGYTPQPQQAAGRMTIDDVITKTAILMLTMVAAAGVSWMLAPVSMLYPIAIVGSLVAFVTVLIVSMRQKVSVPAVFAYAIVEGLMLGAWSKIFEYMYPGIVLQAVIGTIISAFVVLAAYHFLGARVRGRLAQIVVASIIAYAVMSLLNLILLFAGVNLGWASIGASAGPLAWISAALGVVLAAASLLMDFEVIEVGVRNGAPESESWRSSFGLLVTMVWLYTNLLRILSFFRN
ncbi:Bax inhibitor-1/YccA family protein [Brooklawnia sp.]|uniref:Bax inhibitor-1/YccA family protein n=1 Tax=Brooklawnia sp. TaxID=2699740 RepID=UPI0031200439